MSEQAIPTTEAELALLLARLGALRTEVGKVIVGQQETVDHLLVGLLAGGHCLLEGVPCLAKTLMVRTLGDALELTFKRIQFTPDLMPSDIVGTEILEEDHGTGRRVFRFAQGPVFANLLLADEINRSPPKTQAALLEAMQERAVTFGGQTHALPRPFFVLATQNPIEQEGTYPLPEAQLDRFLLHLRIGYPSAEEEVAILAGTTGDRQATARPVLGAGEVLLAQELVRQVHVAPALLAWTVALVRATRPAGSDDPRVRETVDWGAGPRAGQSLVLAAKGRALLAGRLAVTLDDLRAVAAPVLRHRVLIGFRGQAEGVTADALVAHLLATVPPPKSPLE
jgi:MoxR-like ATPase